MRTIIPAFVLSAALCATVVAQSNLPDIGIQSNLALGVVSAVGEEKIEMDTKDGAIDVILQTVTVFKRLPPDNLKLSAASDAVLADISLGDRLLVTGKVSEDKTSIYSNKVFIVKRSELELAAEKQRREWQMRGIAGKVTGVDAEAKTLTVKISSLAGAGTELTVTPNSDARIRRYSGSSAKYSDAVLSDFSKISEGDTLQALGDRSEDGTGFSAEEIVTGSFITVAGTVKAVDTDRNEVAITEFGSNAEIVVVVNENSTLKKFPEVMAQRMARFLSMRQGGQGAGRARAGAEGRERGGRRGGRRGESGPGMRRGPMDINQIAARFPSIGVAELNVGDQIAVSSPKPDDPARVVAIKLLAGVGPFLAAQSGSGRGRRGVSGSLSIPGLDSFDF